ncbi:hypothetical protein N431DRAFT_419997 [Stipitochalara longipes BDJ]|nr:hypothetical protein N431DRAFT_419997 [Stipitochalara longipes BDJ]
MASSTATTTVDSENDEDSQPLTTFHPFIKLPKELRLMIWELIIPGPRIVNLNILRGSARMAEWLRDWDDMIGGPRPGNIKYRAEDFEFPNIPPPFNQWGSPIARWHGTWKVKAPKGPTLLFINQESRRVGMKVYDKTFRVVGMKALTWFSYKQDTLYLSSEVVGRVLNTDELGTEILGIDFNKVQRLLLGVSGCTRPAHARMKYEHICKVIGWFGQLKHLTLVSEHHKPANCDTLVDVPSGRDLENFMKFYNGGYTPEREVGLETGMTLFSDRIQRALAREISGIANQRTEWANQGNSPKDLWNWEMPAIDRMTLTTAECKQEFDREGYGRGFPQRETLFEEADHQYSP